MAEAEYTYKCLRCGNEYKERYDPDWGPKELTCPSCRSNSVRRLPLEQKEKSKDG
jgi:DNA-directed RNA polymerase subunit RPC12/RpoP